MADGAAGLVQRAAEYSQENDGCNNTLKGEEVLDLGVRYAQEGKLEQEVEQKAAHSGSGDALAGGDVIGDVSKAWPDGCEQHDHALTSSRGLDAA
jgi:hypothetical protein